MKRQLAHQTSLIINILVRDDTNVLAYSVFLTTKMFLLLWQTGWFVSCAKYELVMLINDAHAAIAFTGKVLVICLTSLAYGLGMKR